MPKGGSFQVLHGDKRLTILLADVINGADVGMIQGGSGFAPPVENAPEPEHR